MFFGLSAAQAGQHFSGKQRRKNPMNNLVLCGFMGSGKTTVGKKMAKRLNLEFVNTDDIVEQLQQMPISEIFRVFGEKFFRDLETRVCQETVKKQGQLISVGGGTLERPENVEIFRQAGDTILFLNTPFEVCYNRIKGDRSRPVAMNKTKEELFSLYQRRYAQYMAAAELLITQADLKALLEQPESSQNKKEDITYRL